MSTKQISERTTLPERTVSRIFAGETDHPYADTLDLIVKALGYDLGDIFADTNVVVATESLIAVQETLKVVEAERDHLRAEVERLKARSAAQDLENRILKDRLIHQEEIHKKELLSVYNHFTQE